MDRARCALYGFKAVHHGTPDFGQNGRDADGKRTDVADALANVMHYCDANEIDFDHALETAHTNHAAEAAGEE